GGAADRTGGGGDARPDRGLPRDAPSAGQTTRARQMRRPSIGPGRRRGDVSGEKQQPRRQTHYRYRPHPHSDAASVRCSREFGIGSPGRLHGAVERGRLTDSALGDHGTADAGTERRRPLPGPRSLRTERRQTTTNNTNNTNKRQRRTELILRLLFVSFVLFV